MAELGESGVLPYNRIKLFLVICCNCVALPYCSPWLIDLRKSDWKQSTSNGHLKSFVRYWNILSKLDLLCHCLMKTKIMSLNYCDLEIILLSSNKCCIIFPDEPPWCWFKCSSPYNWLLANTKRYTKMQYSYCSS